jgi:PAS domain S-box-containing protein
MVESVVQLHAEIVVGSAEKPKIRVLHVDDERGLLKVAKQCLELQGPFHVDTAGSVEEALNKLKEKEYDAVVSDYQMPGKDGLEFLEMLRKNGNTIPFIMFTGKGREEVAVKAWSLGADHYVNKTGDPETVYCELAHCLRSTVERHFAEAQMKETVQKLQTIYQNAVEGISYVDPEENIVFANKAFADIVGYEQDQLAGMNLHKIVDDENWAKIRSETERRRQGEASHYEAVFRRSDGTVRNALISGAPLLDHDGRFAGTVGIVLDITERKKAEDSLKESEKKYHSLYSSMVEGVALHEITCDRSGRAVDYIILDVNPAFESLTGIKKEKAVGSKASELYETGKPPFLEIYAEVAASAKPTSFETYFPPMKKHFSISVFSPARGKFATVFCDITERKQMEKRTKESEEKYRNLVENSQDAIAIVNFKGNVLFANKAAERLTGYTLKEGKGLNIRVVTPKRYWPKSVAMLLKARMGKPIPYFEYELKRKDGTIVPVETGGQAIFEDGKPVAIQIITREITERRKTEEALRQSEEKYRDLFENSMDAILTLDLKGSITAVNNSVLRFGYKKEDLVGKNILDFVSKEHWPAVMRDFSKVTQGEPAKNETELATPAGEILVEYNAGAIVKENNVAGVQINIRDVTERKKSEELLRESEEKFRGLFESIQDPVGIFVGKEGHLIDYNTAFKKSSGYTDEELKGKVFLDFVHHDDRAMVLEKYRTEYSEDEFPLIYEIRGVNKKGESIPLELSVSRYRKKGNVIGIEVIHRDLTERKKAEEAVKESEAKYRALVEEMPEVIYTISAEDATITSLNSAFEKLTGWERSGWIGKSFEKLIHPDDLSLAMETFQRTIRGEKLPPYELRVLSRSGEFFVGEFTSRPQVERGKIVGEFGIVRDITERKKADRAVLESREKFEGLFVRNPEAAVYLGPDFGILDINPRLKELFGYDLAEIRGRHIDDVVVPKGKINEAKLLNDKAVQGYVYHNTVRRRKNGSLVPVSISAAPIVVGGRLVGYVGMYKNISELRNAEKKLETMNEKLRVVGGLTRHDVRNKLSTIKGNIYLDKKKLADHPEVLQSFKDMESACEQIVRIFEFAKDYERLGVEELTYVDMEKIVDEAVSLFPNLLGIRISNGCRGLVVLADSLLRQLFYNLIDNTLKHGGKATQIRMHYKITKGNQLQLFYEDNGVGIQSDEKRKLFREGHTTGKGSGYGLYLIGKMMDVYGWMIDETGEPGKGARFTISIPETKPEGTRNYRL